MSKQQLSKQIPPGNSLGPFLVVLAGLCGLAVAALVLTLWLTGPSVGPVVAASAPPTSAPVTPTPTTTGPIPTSPVWPTPTPAPARTPLGRYLVLPVVTLPTPPPEPTAPPTVTPLPSPTPPPDPVASGLVPAPPVKEGERWISFNLNDGVTRLMLGRQIVRELPSAFGYGVAGTDSDFYSTAPGQYWVYTKAEEMHYDGTYSGLYFQGWVGFDPARANGFHSYLLDEKGTVVDSRLGPVSHGCIRTSDWKAVYDFAQPGMPVIVHGTYSPAPPQG